MRESKTRSHSSLGQKLDSLSTAILKKPMLKLQLVERLAFAVVLMSSMVPYGNNFADQTPSLNYSQSRSMSSQEGGKETNANNYCLFLSGASAANADIRGIKAGLEKQYGVGKVEAFNSVFNFKDSQNPKRFEQMADFIQSHSKDGLDIVAHSLGAVELQEAIDVVKKRDKTFFDRKENVENLHIVLISPSGFSKNIKSSFEDLGRTLYYFYEELGSLPIRNKNSPYRGIEALTAFPPEGIPSKDLAEALRKAMPELSQYDQSVKTVLLEEEHKYSDNLSADKKEQVKIYSEMMKIAISNGNYDGLRHLVIAYGELLKDPLEQVWAGNFESTTAPIAEPTRATMGGYIELMNTIVEAFGGKPMREIAQLQAKGVRVDFIVPEYEIIVPLENVIAFFDSPEEAYAHTEVLEAVAHAWMALQAEATAKVIKDFEEAKTP